VASVLGISDPGARIPARSASFNSTVGAVHAAEQRNNASWTATIYERSFKKGDLVLWCWFSAGCAGGYRFCSRFLKPAAGRTAHGRDRRLCAWPHLRGGHSQPSSSRSRVRPSFELSPGRHRRHAPSEIYVRRMSCGVKRATPAAAARSRRITATPSYASRRSPTRPPRTARRNNAPAPCPHTSSRARKAAAGAEGARLLDSSRLIGPGMAVNVVSSASYLRSTLCRTGSELRAIGRVSIKGLPGCVLKLLPARRR
jgi:hypothetical protein